MAIKRVVLYDKRRIQPETIELITKAKDGTLIPVDPVELDAFTVLTFDEEKAMKVLAPDPPKQDA